MKTTLKITYTSSRQSKTRLFKRLKQFNCLSTLFRKYLKYYFFRFCAYNFLILHLVHFLILYIQPLILFSMMNVKNQLNSRSSFIIARSKVPIIRLHSQQLCLYCFLKPIHSNIILWHILESNQKSYYYAKRIYLSLCALSW